MCVFARGMHVAGRPRTLVLPHECPSSSLRESSPREERLGGSWVQDSTQKWLFLALSFSCLQLLSWAIPSVGTSGVFSPFSEVVVGLTQQTPFWGMAKA